MIMNNLNLVKEALTIIVNEETAVMDRIVENAPIPPEEIYTKCDEKAQEIINKQKGSLPTKKVVTILIAATLIVSLLAVVTYATRDKIGGFFYEFFDQYVELTPEENLENSISPSNVSISYIPEGFDETRRKIGVATGLYEWTSEDSVITLQFCTSTKGSIALDTDDSNYLIIDVGEITVHQTEKLGQINATWTDEKMLYTLSCKDVEWDEMVKIIEGVKIGE